MMLFEMHAWHHYECDMIIMLLIWYGDNAGLVSLNCTGLVMPL